VSLTTLITAVIGLGISQTFVKILCIGGTLETQNKNMLFSKFFPADNAFVNVSGDFKNKDDWQLSLVIQAHLKEAINLWVAEWNYKDCVEQLLAIQEATNKAIEFINSCTEEAVKKDTHQLKK
jgi:hypothetical protein